MNLTRLAVLGLLAESGPAHGHLLRRHVRGRDAHRWASISDGAINRELVLCQQKGLVSAVRKERVDRRPARTVLAVTDQGLAELHDLTIEALTTFRPAIDPVSVALVFAGSTLSPAERAALLADRQQGVDEEIMRLAAERDRGIAEGFLDPATSAPEELAFRRAELHARAEQAWHRECRELSV